MEQTNILLESGTNELELLEFQVGENVYGINVAKVVEVATAHETTGIPNSSELASDVFILRGEVVSVVDLFKVLGVQRDVSQKTMFITCSFNKVTTAFRVGKVHSIRRISWTDIKTPPRISNTGGKDSQGLLTGIVQVNENEQESLVLILDFEKIVAMISESDSIETDGVEKYKDVNTVGSKRIVVADDSVFLNKMIVSALGDAGFKNIESFQNGKEAWDFVESVGGQDIACVVSDIEMPQLDGLALTKRLKESEKYRGIPVLLFSSLINEQMILKCKSVGADGQFSKPQVSNLIEELIKLLKD